MFGTHTAMTSERASWHINSKSVPRQYELFDFFLKATVFKIDHWFRKRREIEQRETGRAVEAKTHSNSRQFTEKQKRTLVEFYDNMHQKPRPEDLDRLERRTGLTTVQVEQM